MEIKAVDPEFVRVWSRVERAAPESPSPVRRELEEFLAGKLRAESERLASYRTLGLAAPLRECAGRRNALRRGLFFLTGATDLPVPGRPAPQESRKEAVRRLFGEEGLSEGDYRRCAATTDDPILLRLLHACADSCARTRQQLWQSVRLS